MEMSGQNEVAERVEFLRQAMLSADRGKLTGIPMPGLSYGHSNGVLENAGEFVEAIAGGKSKFLKLEFNRQTIQIDGDTAIVRHNMDGSVSSRGAAPADIHLGILQVWKKTGGEWKLLARQACKV